MREKLFDCIAWIVFKMGILSEYFKSDFDNEERIMSQTNSLD